MAKHYPLYFLFLFITASLAIVFFIIQPFFGPLILAMVFAFLFHPTYEKILSFIPTRSSTASLITTMIAVIILLLPVTLIGNQVFQESKHVYQNLISDNTGGFLGLVESSINYARESLPLPSDLNIDISQYAKDSLRSIIQNLGVIFSSFAKILLNVFIFLMAFYFFLKDGDKLKDYIIALSPLNDKDDSLIVSRLKKAVLAVVKGNLTISLIQGTLTGIGFAIFGIPNAVLWGTTAAIAALIPGIGTALVITPFVIFLFFTGNTFNAVGLLLWGMTAVGLVDNVLGPKLVSRNMQIHPLVVFLSVLGGFSFFGPLGFILGPLAISLSIGLIDIYFSLKTKQI